jgi:hypothetical protein
MQISLRYYFEESKAIWWSAKIFLISETGGDNKRLLIDERSYCHSTKCDV